MIILIYYSTPLSVMRPRVYLLLPWTIAPIVHPMNIFTNAQNPNNQGIINANLVHGPQVIYNGPVAVEQTIHTLKGDFFPGSRISN